MSTIRSTDAQERTFFRTDRMTENNGQWFFYTRENTMEGPFTSLLDAQIQLDRYIKVQTSGLLTLDEDKFALLAH